MSDRTSSSITIAVAPATVMDVIADFSAYPQWATGISAAAVVEAGPAGRAERVRFTLDAGLIRDTYVLRYEWEADSAVRWELAEPGAMLTEMSGAYRLCDGGSGTNVSYELTVGTRVPIPGMVRRRAEKTIIDTALRGLKSRAEALAVGRGQEQ